MFIAVFGSNVLINTAQGGPDLLFPRAKDSFPLDPSGKKAILALFYTSSQFALSFNSDTYSGKINYQIQITFF
jgi:hypothetical protein